MRMGVIDVAPRVARSECARSARCSGSVGPVDRLSWALQTSSARKGLAACAVVNIRHGDRAGRRVQSGTDTCDAWCDAGYGNVSQQGSSFMTEVSSSPSSTPAPPDVLRRATCQSCHTKHESLTEDAVQMGASWRCVRCGQRWDAARLAAVAAYATWAAEYDGRA